MVSTHSRLKAAGLEKCAVYQRFYSFNTQPPKGGWLILYAVGIAGVDVSTHSRLKAAGANDYNIAVAEVFQHTAA